MKKNKKVAFYTLGCKVNQYETNAMIQKFVEANYHIVDFDENADIYIINTCTVTNMADRKSRQILRRPKAINKEAIIVVTGCYAQIHKKELEEIDAINIVIGNTEKTKIVEIIEHYINSNLLKLTQATDINEEKDFADFGTTTYTERNRAVIKVQDGCNNFCSYCIIPYAKGRIRSRSKESVLKEIKEISKKGIKEVVITGIHVASYGIDLEGKSTLIDLLEDINKIEGIYRIRLGSLEPKIITKDFVDRISKLEKVCNHFHLSLQSGCNETLKRMNRKYTIEEFEKCVRLLRNAYEDVSLTTDIIVGFPGETEEEFEKTYSYLEKIKFVKMHIFKYSPRQGTIAAKMPRQIEESVKEARSKKLIKLSNKNEKEFKDGLKGRNMEILIEEKNGKICQGYTKNYVMLKTEGDYKENEFVSIKV